MIFNLDMGFCGLRSVDIVAVSDAARCARLTLGGTRATTCWLFCPGFQRPLKARTKKPAGGCSCPTQCQARTPSGIRDSNNIDTAQTTKTHVQIENHCAKILLRLINISIMSH